MAQRSATPRCLLIALAGGLLLGASGCSSDSQGTADLAVQDLTAAPDGAADQGVTSPASPMMSFFISSDTGSGNLGGLAGADARCTRLAEAAGVVGKKWAAYLSTRGGATPGVNARDRIGKGPWYNSMGVKIADDVAGLHNMAAVNLNKQTALTEKGQVVNGRSDTPNQHDILTGSELDGTVTMNSTCGDWTTDADTATATLGHHDRDGGGTNPMSWNSAHASRGCSAQALILTGGAGRIYCFAVQ